MFNKHFNPYDLIIDMQERLQRLEKAHNNLAHAFEATEQELNQTLEILRSLQQHHVRLRQDYDKLKQEMRRP